MGNTQTFIPTIKPTFSLQPSLKPTYSPSCIPTTIKPSFPTFVPSIKPSFPTFVPSITPSSPTRKPSFNPTIVPTYAPTTQPTFVPTSYKPTFEPSTPTFIPTIEPTFSLQPSLKPTYSPSCIPTFVPSIKPSFPTFVPSIKPSIPTFAPSITPSSPTRKPSFNPTIVPTYAPTTPTTQPTFVPTSYAPSVTPTCSPSFTPTDGLSVEPSVAPTYTPTTQPTVTPTSYAPSVTPTCSPSFIPTYRPSVEPSVTPTYTPSIAPTIEPSFTPSFAPSYSLEPSSMPSFNPSFIPTIELTIVPTDTPTTQPTVTPTSYAPSVTSTCSPSFIPTYRPSVEPSVTPTYTPSIAPTIEPSFTPSFAPSYSLEPSSMPSFNPSFIPTIEPTIVPTDTPTTQPTVTPTSYAPSVTSTCSPSFIPTYRPSVEPSVTPTYTPSIAPTIEPSFTPSFAPSYSLEPSSMPSFNPSFIPTIEPTIVPTDTPTTQPTVTPISYAPSVTPSCSPSFIPTYRPSVEPSVTPTYTPSIAPTIEPSFTPSFAPSYSLEPSSMPSFNPSFIPTIEPTIVPTDTPTTQPTTRPSVKPSRFPSVRPTRNPTISPSCKPTSVPSVLPSCNPIISPSITPSLIPTTSMPLITNFPTRPSIIPTAKPTFIPSVTPNTFQPTFTPTLSRAQIIIAASAILTAELNLRLANISGDPNNVFYSVFNQQISDHGATDCPVWDTWRLNQLQLPTTSTEFTSIQVYSHGYNTTSLSFTYNNTAVCTDSAKSQAIVSGLRDGVRTNINCNGHTWRVTTCPSTTNTAANVTGFCVDCPISCSQIACPYQYSMSILSPCEPCADQVSYYTLSLTTTTLIMYPEIIFTTTVVEVSPQTINVTTYITQAGTIYCAAFDPMYSLTSVQDIKSIGFQKSSLNAGLVSVVILNLQPLTNYSVYCYTEDFMSHDMPLSKVLKTRKYVETQCCQKLLYSSFSTQISEYTSTTTISNEQVYIVELDSKPKYTTIPIIISSQEVDCMTLDALDTPTSNASVTIIPSAIQFQSTDKSFQKSFIIRGRITPSIISANTMSPSSICYKIEANDMGEYSNPYYAVYNYVKIISRFSPPTPPVPTDATFTNDGRKITYNFNSDTDRGVSVIADVSQIFKCSLLLNFTGASVSSCLWMTSRQLMISIGVAPQLISLGSDITLLDNAIKTSVCPINANCTFSPSMRITAQNPENPMTPQVILKTSSRISNCSDMRIDTTQSIGAAGRPWKSVLWTVSTKNDNSSTASDIASYLNDMYLTTDIVAVIPQSLFKQTTLDTEYTVTFKLINWLNIMSVSSVTITVSSTLIIPSLTLIAPNSIYRFQSLVVLSTLTQPSCGKNVIPMYTFTWKVYKGLRYMANLVSISKDPSLFKLPPYALELTSESYLIQLTVTASNNSSVTEQTQLVIKPAGVQVNIVGGSSIVMSKSQQLVIDASDSIDLNVDATFEMARLTYIWTCVQSSPSFGDNCISFDELVTNSSIFTTPASHVYSGPETLLIFTVYVSNAAGLTSSASVNVRILLEDLPFVRISSLSKPKYNVGETILLTGSATNTVSGGTAVWSGEASMSLDIIKLTNSLAKSSAFGVNTFSLGFSSSSLVAGSSYVLTLKASYDLNPAIYSSSQITVKMNIPPSNGQLLASPVNGTAVSTSFLFYAFQWSTDPENYPLQYLFYYSTSGADSSQPSFYSSSIIVKNYDTRTSISTVLGQGMKSIAYAVHCLVNVSDVFGGISSATTQVKVYPATDLNAVTAYANTLLKYALDSGDASLIAQSVGAITSSINNNNCTVPFLCSSLNRYNCSQTINTCGQCLSGYIGVDGDSNFRCADVTSSRRSMNVRNHIYNTQLKLQSYDATSSCAVDDDCLFYESCIFNECAPSNKPCLNNCSEQGVCQYFDTNQQLISNCTSVNSFCTAVCQCNSGFYGNDCSLDEISFNSTSQLREKLCSSMYSVSEIQDIDTDVIKSRMTLLANILQDITQISDVALSQCSTLLISTINVAPALAGQLDVALYSLKALNSVLQKRNGLSSNLVANITNTIRVLSSGIQQNLVAGMQVNMFSSYMRLLTSLTDAQSVTNTSFSPSQTSVESYLGLSSPSVVIDTNNTSDGNIFEITVLQYNSNPHGYNTKSASLAVKVTSSTNADFVKMLQLINVDPIYYSNFDTHSSGKVNCDKTSTARPYNVTINCSYNKTFSITCPGTKPAIRHYSCPNTTFMPTCTFWNGNSYIKNPLCIPVRYSSTSTTCLCYSKLSSNIAGRQLQSSESTPPQEEAFLDELSNDIEQVANSFTSTITSITSLNEDVIQNNAVIFSTMLILTVFLFVGLFVFVAVDIKEAKADMKKEQNEVESDDNNKLSHAIKKATPVEFKENIRWIYRLGWKMLAEHDLISCLAKYNAEGDYRAAKWLLLFVFIFNNFFVDTILGVLFFVDSGVCATYTTESQCTYHESLDQINSLCTWQVPTDDNSEASCQFNNDIGGDVLSSLVLAIIIGLLSLPLNTLVFFVVREFRNYCVAYFLKNIEKSKHEDNVTEPDKLNLDGMQAKAVTMLRAARLVKMQQLMDEVSTEIEAKHLKKYIQDNVFKQMTESLKQGILIKKNSKSSNGNPDAESKNSNSIYWNYASHNIITTDEIELIKVIEQVKKDEEIIKSTLRRIENVDEKSEYLLQSFCVSSLTTFRKTIAERTFQPPPKIEADRYKKTWFGLFSCFFVPSYFLFVALFVFLFGVRIGPHMTNVWLTAACVAVLQELLLIKVIFVLAKTVLIPSVVAEDVQTVYKLLGRRPTFIMQRMSGLMYNANSRIQHLNAACRAARSFPELSVSRLLMSLNDSDIPLVIVDNSNKQKSILGVCLERTNITIFAGYSVLPTIVQEVLVQATSVLLVGGLLVLLTLAYAYTFTALLVVVIVVCLFLIGREIYFFRADRSKKLAEVDTIDDVDELMAQQKRIKPSMVASRNRSIKSYSQKNLTSVLETSTVDMIVGGNSIFNDDLSFGIDGKQVGDNAKSKGNESSRINIMNKMTPSNSRQMFNNEFKNNDHDNMSKDYVDLEGSITTTPKAKPSPSSSFRIKPKSFLSDRIIAVDYQANTGPTVESPPNIVSLEVFPKSPKRNNGSIDHVHDSSCEGNDINNTDFISLKRKNSCNSIDNDIRQKQALPPLQEQGLLKQSDSNLFITQNSQSSNKIKISHHIIASNTSSEDTLSLTSDVKPQESVEEIDRNKLLFSIYSQKTNAYTVNDYPSDDK